MTKQVDMTAINDLFLARNIVDGIVTRRRGGIVYTNVPHNCVSHSPTGPGATKRTNAPCMPRRRSRP